MSPFNLITLKSPDLEFDYLKSETKLVGDNSNLLVPFYFSVVVLVKLNLSYWPVVIHVV